MGAQIAAHLVNVKVPVILFDLPAKEGPKNSKCAAISHSSFEPKPGFARSNSFFRNNNVPF
ncbi:hypothetical protein, partial [Rhodoferax sp.]|uniref:hypothetical protein n=1 Tax=Rhodoferax sp. TaxID=50421 RepID=UPI0027215355